jgi:hypothetical protein
VKAWFSTFDPDKPNSQSMFKCLPFKKKISIGKTMAESRNKHRLEPYQPFVNAHHAFTTDYQFLCMEEEN